MPIAAIFAFLARPWVKYLAAAIAAALVIAFMVHRWNAFTDSLRQEGRDEMAQKIALVVKQNDQNNRSLEQSLQTTLNQYGQKLDQSLQQMDSRQQTTTQTITKIIHDRPQIFNNPVCNTPPDVIAERNKIRAEGPR